MIVELVRLRFFPVLTVFLCLPAVLYGGTAPETVTAYPKRPGCFRIVTYNVGVFSKYADDATDMIAQMLLEAQADAVSLNEVDSVNFRHRVNQVQELAGAMGGWQWHFGNTLKWKVLGGYGNAVLVPPDVNVIRSYTVPLGWYIGSERRCISVMETDRYVIGAVHLDHKSSSVRMRQLEYVTQWAEENYAGIDKPVLICGDFNDVPDSEVFRRFRNEWQRLSSSDKSFPSKEPQICIDYIFHFRRSAPITVNATGVMSEFSCADPETASDHLPFYVDILF